MQVPFVFFNTILPTIDHIVQQKYQDRGGIEGIGKFLACFYLCLRPLKSLKREKSLVNCDPTSSIAIGILLIDMWISVELTPGQQNSL